MKVSSLFVVFLLFSYFPLCISDVYEVSTQDGLTLYIDKGDPSIQYITIDDFPVSKENHHISKKYSCILVSFVSSGWKAKASKLSC